MRKAVASTAVALSLLAGGAAGVALGGPSIAGAQTASSSTSSSAQPPSWMADALAKLVADGTITQAQADAVTAALEAARPAGRQHGPGLSVAATAIGIDEATLRDALASGQTIAQVAAAHGVDVQAVIDALVADMSQHLAQAVTDGRITQAQADARSADSVQHATDLVNGVRPAGGPDGPGGGDRAF